jgi:serine/threonine protein kinase
VAALPSHPNLVHYKKVKITSKNRIYLVMELCRSTLRKQFDSEPAPTEQQVWNFLAQVA